LKEPSSVIKINGMNIKEKAPFRQKPVINGQNSLKKPVIKKLMKKLSALYPHCTPELWKEIFPPKCKIVMVKLTNKALIWYIKPKPAEDEPEPAETLPAFFSSTSKDKAPIFPTIFTMWKYPDLVPAYYVHHHICQYIFRGADLMLPGVSPSRSAFQGVEMGSPRCVKVIGNPHPIAVGWAIASEKEIQQNGMRGRGVKILHSYLDELHKMFKSMQPPNKGFRSKIVLPTDENVKLTAAERAMLPPDWEETEKKLRKDAWQSSEDDDDAPSENFEDESGEEKVSSEAEDKGNNDPNVGLAEDKGSEAKPVEDAVSQSKDASSESEESEEEVEEKKESRADQMKRVFEMTLLKITKADLPLSGNDLIERMQQIEDDVDVQSTPWKKVGKFLKEMQKGKLVQFRDKKGKVSIIDVSWKHKRLIDRKLANVRKNRLNNCGVRERDLEKSVMFLSNLLDCEEKPTASDVAANYCKKFKRKGAIVGGPAVLLDYFFGGATKILALGPAQALLTELEIDKPKPEEVEIEMDEEVEDPNSQMLRAFFTAIKDKVKDSNLPMFSSKFYSEYVRECFPPGVTVSIDNTQWGTFTTFLEEQAKTGVILVKPHKDEGLILVKLNREHPDYTNFISLAEDLEPLVEGDEKTDDSIKTYGSVVISQKYKPNGRLAPIFEGVEDHQPNSLYTRPELRRYFVKWLRKHPELRVPRDQSLFRVTPLLYRVILKPKKEKNKAEGWKTAPKTITQREVFARFDRECQQYSAVIVGDNKPRWIYGQIPKILLSLEKRQGGKKHVTHITGLETYGVSPKEFASACRKKFACATTNQKLPGSQQKGKQEVKIQGDLIYDLIEFLGNPATYNIPRQFTEIK